MSPPSQTLLSMNGKTDSRVESGRATGPVDRPLPSAERARILTDSRLLCQGPLHSPAPARTLSTVQRCTRCMNARRVELKCAKVVMIIVLSIARLSTESASLYPLRSVESRRGRCDAETDETFLEPCGGLLSLPHARPLSSMLEGRRPERPKLS